MAYGVVQGVHAVEIVVVQPKVGPDPAGGRVAEIAAHRRDQRIERRDAGHLELAAAVLQRRAQAFVDDGVDDDPRRLLDIAERAVQLPLRADQGVDVLDRQDIVEPGADRTGHGVERLAGGIRHQVYVEVGGELRGGRGHGRPFERGSAILPEK